MYSLLKQAKIKFTYEGTSYETFEKLDYPAENWERVRKNSPQMVDKRTSQNITYTPDFIGENEEWFIEVKGRPNESFPIRWKLFKKKMSERENPPIIFKPTNKMDCIQVVEILKSKGYAKQ